MNKVSWGNYELSVSGAVKHGSWFWYKFLACLLHFIMRYAYGIMSMCPTLLIFNHLMDFSETWHKHYAEDYPISLYCFPTISNTNMAFLLTYKVETPLMPLNIMSCSMW